MATAKQIKLIHCCKGALKLSDDDYRAVLAGYGVTSSKDLSTWHAAKLLQDLETKATAAGVWKTGRAPKRAGSRPTKVDRNAQLKKIEALLTVGGKPWGYADALAKRMCRNADGEPITRVVWVPDEQLFKIITALRKQAQREGWDLSGEA